MSYPREWLGFRNTYEGLLLSADEIVEAVEFDHEELAHGFIGVRVLGTCRNPIEHRHPTEGWARLGLRVVDLAPLTPAAAEFKRARSGE